MIDPNIFWNLPSVWVMPPTAHRTPYPAKLLQDDGGDQVLIAPENDRGVNGESYWVVREHVKFD